ncbi:DNA gyrase inhibitor YacG [Litorivicinus sp.]|nr:DNA gyrase inhibitor YacG [Litorivicinus sp.]
MTEPQNLVVACPNCGKKTNYHPENISRPFCSDRCRLIDLGEWVNGTHRIPGEPVHRQDSEDSGDH